MHFLVQVDMLWLTDRRQGLPIRLDPCSEGKSVLILMEEQVNRLVDWKKLAI